MRKSYITIFSLISFLAGVLSAYFFILISIPVILSVFYIIYTKERKLFFIFFCFFLFGVLRISLIFWQEHHSVFLQNTNQEVQIIGVISDEPNKRSYKNLYTLQIYSLKGMEFWEKVQINTRKDFEYGDVLSISGKLLETKNTEDFPEENYLKLFGIYAKMDFPKITKISHDPPSQLRATLYNMKNFMLRQISHNFSPPHDAFLAGLLIGDRQGLPYDLNQDFRKTGLTHIIAVSGSNITMLLVVLAIIFSFLPRGALFPLSLFSILLFSIFVGMSAAVIRAAIMGSIGFVAIHTGKKQSPCISLLLTCVIMTLYQPYILFYDVGFQLSVSAVIGIIWVVPILPKILLKIPKFFGIQEAILMSLAAQITTLPISLYHFHAFSLIAPIANVFAVPAIPFILLSGFLALFPLPILSLFLQKITEIGLDYILYIAENFAKIPSAYFEEIFIPTVLLILYYIIILLFILHKKMNINPTQIKI